MPTGPLRIGEFARRVGVRPELLRAWERRYGLLRPIRSPGGFRLYTEQDAERVARMRAALDDGLSAAQAARACIADDPPTSGNPAPPSADTRLVDTDANPSNFQERLLAALKRFDEDSFQSVLDDSVALFGLEIALRDLIFPALREVGRSWASDDLGISQEHFASNLIRGRLSSLARLWGRGTGPLAVLACAPGEAHDISLLAFGLLLRSHGWRIVFLGADTPTETLAETVKEILPALVVVTSFDPALFAAHTTAFKRLARRVPLTLGGPGASEQLCSELGLPRLGHDLIAAADQTAGSR